MAIKIECEDGYTAREWTSKDGEKHNIFIKDRDGEVGWLDLKTGKLVNKSKRNYDFVEDEEDAIIIVESGDSMIYIGCVDDDSSPTNELSRSRLQEANERFNSLKLGNVEFEINLGPSREIRKGGKSNWAKANITAKVSNPENIEEIYDALSEMAFAMLDLETEKLLNDRQA